MLWPFINWHNSIAVLTRLFYCCGVGLNVDSYEAVVNIKDRRWRRLGQNGYCAMLRKCKILGIFWMGGLRFADGSEMRVRERGIKSIDEVGKWTTTRIWVLLFHEMEKIQEDHISVERSGIQFWISCACLLCNQVGMLSR